MAGENKEEFSPLLPPGWHVMDIPAVRRLCVARFPDSIVRGRIMTLLEEVISMMQQARMRGQLWIDGSFTTQKLNPDDVDVILVVPAEDFIGMDAQQLAFINWFRGNSLKQSHKCDNYFFIRNSDNAINEYTYAYWLRQFGFSRANEMKGFAVVNLPFLVMQ